MRWLVALLCLAFLPGCFEACDHAAYAQHGRGHKRDQPVFSTAADAGAADASNPDAATDAGLSSAASVDLNGTSQCLKVSDFAGLSFGATFSALLWFKKDTSFDAGDVLLSMWGANSQNEWKIALVTTGVLGVYINSILTDTGSNRGNITLAGNYSADTWGCLLVVYTGGAGANNSDRLHAYKNSGSNIIGSYNGTIPATLPNGTGRLSIGGQNIAASGLCQNFFGAGNIDEVALFNNDQTANRGTLCGAHPVDLTGMSGLVAWWRLEDATDSGGGGHNLSNEGSPSYVADVP